MWYHGGRYKQRSYKLNYVLMCSNKECDSHSDDQHLFTINCTFDENRCLAETMRRVEPQYFECVFCGDKAEDTKEL